MPTKAEGVEQNSSKLQLNFFSIDMNHGQVYSAATKTVKCFISTAEASQVIINKAFLGSFSGVGSKMEGVLLQVTNEEVVNHRVFKK